MTRKSRNRLTRDRRKIPRRDNIASVSVDRDNERILFTTNDMLVNQLHRDCPRVAKTFDLRSRKAIADCSAVFGLVIGMLLPHLPRVDEIGFKATAARLLYNAANSCVASIQVARNGYPRQYGAVARMLIEALAIVIVLAIKEGALEDFHSGKLDSNKCVGWSKAVLPPMAKYWGMLSNDFVHIGPAHATFDGPVRYTDNDPSLQFLVNSIKGNIWLLYVVTDLVVSDEANAHRFWRRKGQEAWFEPSSETQKWTEEFFGIMFAENA